MWWTKDKITQLKSLHASNLTPRAIAPILGTTRSAVIGKINRLKLRRFLPKPPGTLTPPDLSPLPSNAIGLLDLVPSSCRYPVAPLPNRAGAHLFCGASVTNPPYCPTHAAMCYLRR